MATNMIAITINVLRYLIIIIVAGFEMVTAPSLM